MARLLGVVDAPGGAAGQPLAGAAARRDRALPRHLRAGARVPAARPRHARAAARRGRRRHGRRDRRLPRAALVARSSAARCSRPPCRSWFGVWVDRFTFPFLGIHALPAWVGVPLTIVWIVAIMNMVNFLDGLDGLAAGVAAIAGLTFAVIALSLAKPDAAILSAIVFGACVGFLRHNFYPARIFMGDSGRAAARLRARDDLRPGPAEDGGDRRAVLPAARARGADRRHDVRRRAPAQARREGVRGRPGAPPPPLPPARLLAAARGADDLGVVRLARRARRSRRASSRSARTASGTSGRRSPRPRSASSRSRSRSTSSTCSRS